MENGLAGAHGQHVHIIVMVANALEIAHVTTQVVAYIAFPCTSKPYIL